MVVSIKASIQYQKKDRQICPNMGEAISLDNCCVDTIMESTLGMWAIKVKTLLYKMLGCGTWVQQHWLNLNTVGKGHVDQMQLM